MRNTPARLVLLVCVVSWGVACGVGKGAEVSPDAGAEGEGGVRKSLVVEGFVPKEALEQETRTRIVVAADPQGGIVSEASLPSQRYETIVNGRVVAGAGKAPFTLARIGEGHPNYTSDFDSTTPAWFAGAEHIYRGDILLDGWHFDSRPEYPLTFKVVPKKGYTYLCGKGTVTTPAGNSWTLGERDTVEEWVARSRSPQPLDREAAAQALGYLAQGAAAAPRSQVVQRLQELLGDTAFEVRRDAIEALVRLKATEARESIARLAGTEPDAWVRDTAAWAVKELGG